ncbi:SCO family protein [Inhella sp. 1Y17]|uniref:SCO family protein n=1 Tax=Inhella proteolytica TaxID=2795029 RepID=A0A931NFE7_9BURK|nr:SCO family protein [Inhella proteolytica]
MAPTVLACLLVVIAAGIALWWLTLSFEAWTFEERRHGLVSRGALSAPPIQAIDQTGEVWTAPWSIKGAPTRVVVLDFVYTRCETVCTALGGTYAQMQAALEQSPAGAAIQLISLSFDARDDLRALQRYADRYRARAPTWRVLHMTDPFARQNVLRTLGVVAIPDGLGGFVHNGALHVIDASGQVRGLFDYADWPQALALARKLSRRP